LKPELAAAVGPDRFLLEIRIAARLSHPNILALHDSGNAGQFLYYAQHQDEAGGWMAGIHGCLQSVRN
jgi:hypothetical protein